MAFEIKYSDEAKRNLDTITTWLLYGRQAGDTALHWLRGLREKDRHPFRIAQSLHSRLRSPKLVIYS
jgi:hypothetical protein